MKRGRPAHERKMTRKPQHQFKTPTVTSYDLNEDSTFKPNLNGHRVCESNSGVGGSGTKRALNRDMECCTTKLLKAIKTKTHTEQGFMGMTHALSACALVLALIAFAPLFMEKVLGVWQISFVALLCLALIGGALMPDLDNTNSSANSALGFVGDGISAVMRATAPIVKNMVHTKYDKDLDNPHRSFYHTGVSAILVGGLGAGISAVMRATAPIVKNMVHTKYDKDLDNPHRSFYHTGVSAILVGGLGAAACAIPGMTGKICAMVLAFIGAHVALSTLLKGALKKAAGKSNKIIGALLPLVFSLAVVAALWFTLPKTVPYWEIGVAFGLGWLVHILGDMCTTSGVPILWPVPIRGKMWYDVRLLKIKAGGAVENVLFIPLFTIIIIISVVVICTSHVYH